MNRQLLGDEWFELLEEEMKKDYFLKLKETLKDEYNNFKIYPAPSLIFEAFKLTPPNNVKVVLTTQDPYFHSDLADGLAFSTKQKDTPYSLQRIFREVDRDVIKSKDYNEFKAAFPSNDLTNWARKGVFLINVVLTVRAGESNSHSQIGWQQFTKTVLQTLATDSSHKAFCLWGKDAQDLAKGLTFHPNHLVLETGHPASGAHAKDKYSGCGHFTKINHYFMKNNLEQINWTLNG